MPPIRPARAVDAAAIRAVHEAAFPTGAEARLVGEPACYARFGFTAEAEAPVASPYAGPFFMAPAPGDPWTAPASGRAEYAAPAFAVLETQE